MRFSLAWRQGVALALMGVMAAGLTGYYGYTESRALLQSAAEQRLLTASRVLARQLSVGLENVAHDVRVIAGHSGARDTLLLTDAEGLARTSQNTALLFRSMLDAHPAYFQIRLIAAADYGMERVRVDRSQEGALRVEGDDLQEKGHFAYVVETLRLPPGAVFVSRAGINHAEGVHASQDKPSLQVATPVHDASGAVLGLVVINVDLDGLFRQLAADLPSGLQLYLTNSEGDFLIHPRVERAFAFDRGQRALVQEEFPAAAALLVGATERKDQLVTTVVGTPDKDAAVAAFVRQPLSGLHSEDDFIIGIGQPLQDVLAESDRLGAVSLRIVLGFSALAIMLSALLARALTRPLKQIVNAVRHFGEGTEGGTLPSRRQDEIGMLARSIEQMQQQIRAQFAKLEQKQQELDRLASHDNLTGLPNRRLFLDRLQQTLARARRNDGQLALLFIDLDDFKYINDTLGHAAGDAVLCAVGLRLGQLVREVDTVARLGGDEFVILLDGADDPGVIEYLAQRVLAAVSQQVVYDGMVLACSGSIGISRFPQDATGVTELIAAADQAMYRAKGGGGKSICFAREMQADQ